MAEVHAPLAVAITAAGSPMKRPTPSPSVSNWPPTFFHALTTRFPGAAGSLTCPSNVISSPGSDPAGGVRSFTSEWSELDTHRSMPLLGIPAMSLPSSWQEKSSVTRGRLRCQNWSPKSRYLGLRFMRTTQSFPRRSSSFRKSRRPLHIDRGSSSPRSIFSTKILSSVGCAETLAQRMMQTNMTMVITLGATIHPPRVAPHLNNPACANFKVGKLCFYAWRRRLGVFAFG